LNASNKNVLFTCSYINVFDNREHTYVDSAYTHQTNTYPTVRKLILIQGDTYNEYLL